MSRRRRWSTLPVLLGLLAASWGSEAADVKFAVVRAAAPTSVTTQTNLRSTGFGTPKAAIILMNYATANNTSADNAAWSIGFLDCTNQLVVHAQDRADGLTSTDGSRRAATTAVAELLEVGTANGATLDGIAAGSCVTDGINLNWTTALSAAYFVHAVLFGGSDVQAKVGTFVQNSTSGGTTTINTVGFTPESVFCLGIGLGSATWNGGSQANARVAFGVATAVNGGAIAQGGVAQHVSDNVTTTAYTGGTMTAVACNSAINAQFLDAPVSLGSFSSTGFVATSETAGTTNQYGYLAITTNGTARQWAGAVAAPSTPQVQAYTGPGWSPLGVLLFLSGAPTGDTEILNDDAGQVGVGMGERSGAEYTLSTRGDDGELTVNTASLSVDTAVAIRNQTGTARWTASLTTGGAGMTPTGWSLNFTTATAVAAWWGWALESAEVQGMAGIPLWARP